MKQFNVIYYDFNTKRFEPYDIIPYLAEQYKKAKSKPKTLSEFKEFIKSNSMYQWWARCEYEVLLSPWPPSKKEASYKMDIHEQVMMNIDVIANLLMETV